MAGRQLKELFRAFRTNDELPFRRAALEIIEEDCGPGDRPSVPRWPAVTRYALTEF